MASWTRDLRPFNGTDAETKTKEKEPEKPGESEKKEKPKLALTWDNVQEAWWPCLPGFRARVATIRAGRISHNLLSCVYTAYDGPEGRLHTRPHS